MKIVNIFLLIICIGCLENDSILESNIEISDEAVLLYNLEKISNDYINNSEIPPLITVDELNQNLDKYLILDIRSIKEFKKGHIESSHNINSGDLYEYIKNNQNSFNKIVIVSYTGQAACYYATLLSYAGLQNIYALEFGMCYWNYKFSNYWITSNERVPIDRTDKFTPLQDSSYYYNLPVTQIKSNDDLINRIETLLVEEFTDTTITDFETGNNFTLNTTHFNYVKDDDYIICYGDEAFMFKKHIDILREHSQGTVFYFEDFIKSSKYLMTIQPDKKVVVYSMTGMEGACLVAYLRILGFDAKNIVFGTYSYRDYFISDVNNSRRFNYFDPRLIRNYHIVYN